MRLFIAVELPSILKREIKRHCQRFGSVHRWNPIEQMHLTLRFIGEAEEEQVEKIKDQLARITLPQFVAKTGTTGFFPKDAHPQVFWLGFQQNPQLEELQREIDNRMKTLGFMSERRSYIPHITLTGFKRGSHKKLVEKIKENFKTFPEVDFPIEKITLFSSSLSRKGAVHEKLASYDLANW